MKLTNPAKTMKRMLRNVSKNGNRPILRCVHLGDGEVAATDSYRLCVQKGVWDGKPLNVAPETARELSKLKGESAEVTVKGSTVRFEVGGEVVEGELVEGKYPEYGKMLKSSCRTLVYVNRDELLAKVREVIKLKNNTLEVTVKDGLVVNGTLFEDAAVEGDELRIGFNPTYMRDALLSIESKVVRIAFDGPLKPAIISGETDFDVQVLLMPVRLDAGKKKGAKGMRKAPKRPEPKSGKVESLKGERVCITGTLGTMTRGEAFTRLKLAGGIPSERFSSKVTMLVVAENSGNEKRRKAEAAIAKGQKVKVVSGTEFEKALMSQGRTAGERKQEEHMAKKEGINREGLAELLYALAIDRAAKEPDNRLAEGNASPNSATYVWRLQKDGRLKHEDYGSYTSWYLDGDFVTCIERRYSMRKIHLHYPEIKPAQHGEDLVMKCRTEQKLAENGVKAEVKATEAGAGITAVTIEPKKPAVGKEGAEMKNRIEELEKMLAETRKELESVWKENEGLKRKVPKAEPEKPAKSGEEAAAEVSLATMQKWCEGKGLVASQKREGACIWVEGDSKPYKDELVEMGFRFAKKRKSWYLNPAA